MKKNLSSVQEIAEALKAITMQPESAQQLTRERYDRDGKLKVTPSPEPVQLLLMKAVLKAVELCIDTLEPGEVIWLSTPKKLMVGGREVDVSWYPGEEAWTACVKAGFIPTTYYPGDFQDGGPILQVIWIPPSLIGGNS